jgi:hypothetical protein
MKFSFEVIDLYLIEIKCMTSRILYKIIVIYFQVYNLIKMTFRMNVPK